MLNAVLMERARNAEIRKNQTINADESATSEERIMIEGSTKESLLLLPTDFLFAESEGNYVSIHLPTLFFLKKNRVGKTFGKTFLLFSSKNGIKNI